MKDSLPVYNSRDNVVMIDGVKIEGFTGHLPCIVVKPETNCVYVRIMMTSFESYQHLFNRTFGVFKKRVPFSITICRQVVLLGTGKISYCGTEFGVEQGYCTFVIHNCRFKKL